MPNTNDTQPRRYATLAAIDTYVERTIITPRERKVSNGDRYQWGEGDRYPLYLEDLYDNATTLNSVIGGLTDYIAGDDVLFRGKKDEVMNRRGETASDLVRQAGDNLGKYGGVAFEIVRAKDGSIAETYVDNLKTIRTNKENTTFWYSEKWGTSRPEPVTLPAFMPDIAQKWAGMTDEERQRHAVSILLVKMDAGRVYPVPPYAAAVRACEIERGIDDFHLSSLANGFAPSAIVSLLNGVPQDEEKAEIERNFYEKYTGSPNAARIMLNFADDKEHAAVVEALKTEDFGERYNALAKRASQEIFTAFRAIPALFGINPENNGFAEAEYAEAFKLFNRTQVRPRQRKIADAFARIYGEPVLEIIPFSIESTGETAVN